MADIIYTGTADGHVQNTQFATTPWSDVRAMASGTVAETDTVILIYNNSYDLVRRAADQYTCHRILIPFNTGAVLPAGAAIVGATLTLENDNQINAGTNSFVYVTQGAQPDETTLTTGDYSAYEDALDSPEEGGSRLDVSTDGTKVSAFNATGKRWIKKAGEASAGGGSAGWTKILLRGYYDVEDIAPLDGTSEFSGRFSSSEGANSPSFTVTWNPPPLPAVKLKGSQMRLKGSKVLIK